MFIKSLVRRILCVREKENIRDAIDRKKYHFLKHFIKKKYNTQDIKKIFLEMGIRNGDTLIVHCSWRAFVGFTDSPNSIIDLLIDLVGDEGTILMPCFSKDKTFFDYESVTSAGVLAEIFRKNYSTDRSIDNIFSMAAYGKNSSYYTSTHLLSKYAFDDESPYMKAIDNEAKVVLLGLGRKPHKITLFHCVTYKLRNKLHCYNIVYNEEVNFDYIDKNREKHSKTILMRNHHIQNNIKKFRKLFKKENATYMHRRINCLDIFVINSKELYRKSYDDILKRNIYLYRGNPK